MFKAETQEVAALTIAQMASPLEREVNESCYKFSQCQAIMPGW